MSETPHSSTRAGTVALLGRSNVGKSTLLNALLGEPIAITSPHPHTTRDPVRGVLTLDRTQYVFLDTAGVHKPRSRLGRWMNEASHRHAREADVVVLVAEVPRPSADPPRPHPADIELARELAGPSLLVLNKVDRLRDKSALLPLIAAHAQAHPFAAVVPLSARREAIARAPTDEGGDRDRAGIERLLDELRPLLPEQPFLHARDTLSDQPERFFVGELVREQVLRHTRLEVPHGAAVVVDTFDETVRPFRISATIHVARAAHTKILVGAGGRMLKSIGSAARARIEHVLGARVHLSLRVRATEDWMNDEARLRELGYGAAGP